MPNKKLFCLFIHVGRFLKDKADMIIMPLGLPMLAGVLDSNGFPSLVFNSGLSKLMGGEQTKDIIEKYSPDLIALDLHWHHQLSSVINEISMIKKAFPKIPIAVGGFTASCFAEKLIALENSPDYIIRGDGEKPLLELAKNLKSDDKSSVPNLTWKKKSADGTAEIVSNPLSYIADTNEISGLNYARYDLVLNSDPAIRGTVSLNDSVNDIINDSRIKTVFYSPGRGCPYNCAFCGGGSKAQMIINGRKGYFFKTYESALDDIKGFIKQGFERIHISFDPEPGQKWYAGFFSLMRKYKISINMIFENWGLPSDEFLKSFALTFQNNLQHSRIIISPESGSEDMRRKNKGFFYTNSQLEHSLQICSGLNIKFELFFAASLPGDTAEDFLKTVELASRIAASYDCKINMENIIPDPCSPIVLNGGSIDSQTLEKAEKRKKYFHAKMRLLKKNK